MKLPLLWLGLILLLAAPVAAQTTADPVFQKLSAIVTSNAPIYVVPSPGPTLGPIRTAAVGTVLVVLNEKDNWLQVEFNDPQFGRRVGWVEKKLVRIDDPALRPLDLSVPAERARPPGTPPSTSAPRPPPQRTGPGARQDFTGTNGTVEPKVLSILVGVMHARAIAFESNNSNLIGLTGPSLNVTFEMALEGRLRLNLSVGGMKSSSFAADLSGFGSLDTRLIGPEILLRVYTSPRGQSRGFIEVGPTINFARVSIDFRPLFGSGIVEDFTETKFGFIFGGGAEIPMGDRFGMAIVGGYHFIPKLGTVDFSQVRVLGGLTVGF